MTKTKINDIIQTNNISDKIKVKLGKREKNKNIIRLKDYRKKGLPYLVKLLAATEIDSEIRHKVYQEEDNKIIESKEITIIRQKIMSK